MINEGVATRIYVNLGYIINVIENMAERHEALLFSMLLDSKRVGGIEPPSLAWKAIVNVDFSVLSAC